MNPLLTKAYNAETAVSAYHIVKHGTNDGEVAHAAANTDGFVGVSNEIAADAGQRVDIIKDGIGEVILGGEVARGAMVTSDASGHGVALSSTMLEAGACFSLGRAEKAGVSGDIIPVHIEIQKVSQYDAVTASADEINVLDGISATLTAAELSILDGVTATAAEINALDAAPLDVDFVIGEEGSNAINVGIQLNDAGGTALSTRASVLAYLSDDANGDSIVATAPDGGWAIGTDGLLIPVVANKAAQLVSEADGDIDVTITHAAGEKTVYLIVVLPNGKLVASTAITFAA